jgi:hypothetical protein
LEMPPVATALPIAAAAAQTLDAELIEPGSAKS